MEIYNNLSLDNLENEVWKDIPNYEGIYQASNMGRVKALPRQKNHSSGKGLFLSKEKILKQSSGNRYFNVGLYKDGRDKTTPTHLAVAYTFLNHTPKGHGIHVDHINNISTDNRLENLQIISSRLNTSKNMVNKTGFSGVIKTNSFFQSTIQFKGKLLNLGFFKTAELASEKYKEAFNLVENKQDISHLHNPRTNLNKFTGVCKIHNRFQSRINVGDKFIQLGIYDTAEEAGLAYQKALEMRKRGEEIVSFQEKKLNELGYKGISRSGNKFRVRIYLNHKNVGLGTFDTLELAIESFRKATEEKENNKANL